MDDWRLRLKQRFTALKAERRMTQQSLADCVGVTQGTIGHWINGRRTPTELEQFRRLAKCLDTSFGWLLTGIEDSGAGRHLEAPGVAGEGAEYTFVPRYRVEASAGSGGYVDIEEIEDRLAFRADWLRQHGLSARSLVIIHAHGDSMAPRIQSGDTLLVDSQDRDPKDGKVYALRYDDRVKVKRLVWRHDGALIIRSDNPAPQYRDEVVIPEDLPNLSIIGRVVWIGGGM